MNEADELTQWLDEALANDDPDGIEALIDQRDSAANIARKAIKAFADLAADVDTMEQDCRQLAALVRELYPLAPFCVQLMGEQWWHAGQRITEPEAARLLAFAPLLADVIAYDDQPREVEIRYAEPVLGSATPSLSKEVHP